jgi:hypothetical protein
MQPDFPWPSGWYPWSHIHLGSPFNRVHSELAAQKMFAQGPEKENNNLNFVLKFNFIEYEN